MKTPAMTSRQATAYSALALAVTLSSVGLTPSHATTAALTWKKAVDDRNDRRERFMATMPDRRPNRTRVAAA